MNFQVATVFTATRSCDNLELRYAVVSIATVTVVIPAEA